MAGKNIKTVFACQSCGCKAPKWIGRCPECGEWDSFIEERVSEKKEAKSGAISYASPVPINSVDVEPEFRILTGINEFDRVLGGGIVPGTIVLIGGDPGVGKSTLMMQALNRIAHRGEKILYITGEESIRQIRIRGNRLNAVSGGFFVASETDILSIISMFEKEKPAVVVIDSIQTMFNPELTSAPGSVTQVRESTVKLMLAAKQSGVPVFLVGHVTKDGAIAGPRLLEHIVDTVLYFEGDKNHIFRILRAVKNRFGSTNEIGVFEMKGRGLCEVANPSAIFLSERPADSPGSIVTSIVEGSRPVLIEIQALASSTSFGNPRRTILGIDQNRVALLTAVMEKKLGMHLMGHDIFMNVVGRVKIDEPAVDLAVVCAVASSFLDKTVKAGTAVLGEVGLTGEVRAVGHIQQRINEVKKMGFTTCIIPNNNMKQAVKGVELIGAKNIMGAVEALF